MTNRKRAEMASAALDVFSGANGLSYEHEPLDEQISDLITDLLHLAAMNGEDVEVLHKRAWTNFDVEQAEEQIGEARAR